MIALVWKISLRALFSLFDPYGTVMGIGMILIKSLIVADILF